MSRRLTIFVPPGMSRARGWELRDVISILAQWPGLLREAPDGRPVLQLPFSPTDTVEVRHGARLTTEAAGSVWAYWWRFMATHGRMDEGTPRWPSQH